MKKNLRRHLSISTLSIAVIALMHVGVASANPYWDATSATAGPTGSRPIEGVPVTASASDNNQVVTPSGADGAPALPDNQTPDALQAYAESQAGQGSQGFQKTYIASLPAPVASTDVATDLEGLSDLVQKSWTNYFTLKQDHLFNPDGLNLLWTGMDYQDLNTLPNVMPASLSSPIFPVVTVNVAPGVYNPSGNQVVAVLSAIRHQVGSLYATPMPAPGAVGAPQQSQMQVLQNAVLAPFQNPADSSTNPGWLAQINTASTPQLLRATALELAVNNAINFQQLRTEQLSVAAEGQVLAEQLKIETQLHTLSETIGSSSNITAELLEQGLQQRESEHHAN